MTNPGNWRPVSNTNIFAKLLEKLVHKQLSHFIFSNDIISINLALSLDVQLMKQFLSL